MPSEINNYHLFWDEIDTLFGSDNKLKSLELTLYERTPTAIERQHNSGVTTHHFDMTLRIGSVRTYFFEVGMYSECYQNGTAQKSLIESLNATCPYQRYRVGLEENNGTQRSKIPRIKIARSKDQRTAISRSSSGLEKIASKDQR